MKVGNGKKDMKFPVDGFFSLFFVGIPGVLSESSSAGLYFLVKIEVHRDRKV